MNLLHIEENYQLSFIPRQPTLKNWITRISRTLFLILFFPIGLRIARSDVKPDRLKCFVSIICCSIIPLKIIFKSKYYRNAIFLIVECLFFFFYCFSRFCKNSVLRDYLVNRRKFFNIDTKSIICKKFLLVAHAEKYF